MKPKPIAELPHMVGPMKWPDFEAEIKRLGFSFYWQRYNNFGNIFHVTGPNRSSEPPFVEIGPAIEQHVRCKTENLAESKREVCDQAREIISRIESDLTRVSRLIPIAASIIARDSTEPHYARPKVVIYTQYISVSNHYEEVRILDDLSVEVRFDYTNHTATIGELEETIERMKHVRADYETFLEPFLSDWSMEVAHG